MSNLEVNRTTFKVEGVDEPCIIVSNGYTEVRISKCYHFMGRDSLYMRESLGSEYNNEEEWVGEFDLLSDYDAIELAKQFSVYL